MIAPRATACATDQESGDQGDNQDCDAHDGEDRRAGRERQLPPWQKRPALLGILLTHSATGLLFGLAILGARLTPPRPCRQFQPC
jgi:hypothetical protein